MGGALDRTVRHLMSEWGWPGAALFLGGLLMFLIGESVGWRDLRAVPNDVERMTALGVALVGLVWILISAAYYRISRGNRRGARRGRAKRPASRR